MRLRLIVYFVAVLSSMAVNADRSDKSCAKPFNRVMLCNLMCNMLQDSGANEAIKTLQNKLESLVAVVNNSLLGKLIFKNQSVISMVSLMEYKKMRNWREAKKTSRLTVYSSFSWSLLAIGIPSDIDSSNIARPALSDVPYPK